MLLAAVAPIRPDFPGQLRNIPLLRSVAKEALLDAGIRIDRADRSRVGIAGTSHFGDLSYSAERCHRPEFVTPEGRCWRQWLPSCATSHIADELGLTGPRVVNSTACASGSIAVIQGLRMLRDGQCDYVLAGGSEVVTPLTAAGFHTMRVLAPAKGDPTEACRPFDQDRCGFVLGEGAAMLLLERLETALRRGAPIYAELLSGRILTDTHHLTSLDVETSALPRLISDTLRQANLVPRDVDHVNTHGTGTQQNDVLEARSLRRVLGKACDRVSVTANKAMFGHLLAAAGTAELGLTLLAMRDGFSPPTLNLRHPDPECDIDATPLVGRDRSIEHALKLSVAFGGHLAAIAVRRWNGPGERSSLRVRTLAA
jgi:3-oxoacyl-(acyl-carrier-protein) synthase